MRRGLSRFLAPLGRADQHSPDAAELLTPPTLASGTRATRVRVIDDRLLERYPRLRPLAQMTFLVLE